MKQNIQEKDDREWLLIRPQVVIGSVQPEKAHDFFMENNKFKWTQYNYIPGFLKIINEILDNSIDVYVKSKGKYANQINIDITDDSINIKDNGYGIPVEKSESGEWLPFVCWGKARAGSNFEDDKNQGQIGMNGIGSFATVVFSKEFIGYSDDGKNKLKITFKDNLESHSIRELTSSKPGVEVFFKPDLEKFGLEKIDDTHKNLIYQRLLNLSVTYPGIKFTFNKKRISLKTKDYLKMFSDDYEIIEGDNFFIGVMPNSDDDFRFLSYVNGLHIKDGGNHIDYVLDKIVSPIRTKLQRRYKNIKPGDIKNKLQIVVFFKNLINPKFNSQTKEKLTNTSSQISNFLGDIDWDKFGLKCYKNKAILEPIVEIYKIKEEFKKKQELKNLNKTVKKIKSKKYTRPIGNRKYLMIGEGESAVSGLLSILGRKDYGYYELKGKPLNAYDASQQKFTANTELSELYQIINNEEYEYIVFATDQDLDGFTIRGLLLGFIYKYIPELLKTGRIGMLQTPIVAVSKKDKIINWYYNLSDVDHEKTKPGTLSEYKKGLGGWTSEELKVVIEKDGIDKMIRMIEYNDETSPNIIDNWLNSDKSDKRKEYIANNDFDLIKL